MSDDGSSGADSLLDQILPIQNPAIKQLPLSTPSPLLQSREYHNPDPERSLTSLSTRIVHRDLSGSCSFCIFLFLLILVTETQPTMTPNNLKQPWKQWYNERATFAVANNGLGNSPVTNQASPATNRAGPATNRAAPATNAAAPNTNAPLGSMLRAIDLN